MKLSDLENYRRSDGYISIDDIGFVARPEDREIRGSIEREKDWMQLVGTSVLLRTELFKDDEEKNFCSYAELIFEELAKQVDFHCAHYDLIEYKGKKGVLSRDVRTNAKEEFYTLADIIGNPNQDLGSSSVPTDFEDVIQKLKELLKSDELYKEDVLDLSKDFAKMLILDIYCMSTDRHIENCGVIVEPGNDGKKHIRLAPVFDNECSLMLDIPIYELEELSKSDLRLNSRQDVQEPLIALSAENSYDDMSSWQNMIEFLSEKDEFFDFATLCSEKLDIEKAIEEVENRIGTKIPSLAKDIATRSFDMRRDAIREALLLDLDMEIEEKHEDIEEDDPCI